MPNDPDNDEPGTMIRRMFCDPMDPAAWERDEDRRRDRVSEAEWLEGLVRGSLEDFLATLAARARG